MAYAYNVPNLSVVKQVDKTCLAGIIFSIISDVNIFITFLYKV